MPQMSLPDQAVALLNEQSQVGLLDDPFELPPGCVLEEISVPYMRPTVWDGKRSRLLDHPRYAAGSVWAVPSGGRVRVIRSEVIDLKGDGSLRWVTYVQWAPGDA